MQLLVGIEVQKLAARVLLREPGVEARRDQAVGALLLVGGADGDDVSVFILHVLVVPADPAPVHQFVRLRDLRQLLPQLDVLERAGLAPPARASPRAPVAPSRTAGVTRARQRTERPGGRGHSRWGPPRGPKPDGEA